jgi:hypothetical protein
VIHCEWLQSITKFQADIVGRLLARRVLLGVDVDPSSWDVRGSREARSRSQAPVPVPMSAMRGEDSINKWYKMFRGRSSLVSSLKKPCCKSRRADLRDAGPLFRIYVEVAMVLRA